MSAGSIEAERERRLTLWQELQLHNGGTRFKPAVLHDLRIYRGAQGIWVDKETTRDLTATGEGVTVSVLHKGERYPDDLAETCVLYHYPETNRPRSRDVGEIAATKNCKALSVPLFVVVSNATNRSLRDVKLGWVGEWDDAVQLFLIDFADQQPTPQKVDDVPFVLHVTAETRKRTVTARLGRDRFRFLVLARYGPRCAFCDLAVPDLLEAAHICPPSAQGCDDPRNGLVLCLVHRRALNVGLIGIHPRSGKLLARPNGPDLEALKVTRKHLSHLPKRPHQDALAWHYSRWQKRVAGKGQ